MNPLDRPPVASFDTHIAYDHEMIRFLYQKFRATSANNHAARNRLINSLIRELAVHCVTEEVVIYPQFEKYLSRGMQIAQQARQEHQQLKNDLYELDEMKEDDPKLPILLKKVMDEFNEHAKDEEIHILPLLKSAISTELAIQLGDKFQNFKKFAPTHPHPSAPDKGGLTETLIGFMIRPVDMLRDMMSEFAY